jgi:hypothetical protein
MLRVNEMAACVLGANPLEVHAPEHTTRPSETALAKCDLPTDLTWYQFTRNTFASQWVMATASIEKLAAVLGHSSTEVTRRYAHLPPEHFGEASRQLLDVDLAHARADVVPLAKGGALGPKMAQAQDVAAAKNGDYARKGKDLGR